MTPSEIRTLRETLGWTNKRLAEACGVSERTVKHWQAGTRHPSGPALLLLRNLQEKQS